ncbi:NAD(P)-dependent oxidoreductase [uncultured Agrococcus sp.]|uniref:NAD(P)-dependent oxidoreductase n=1 Tax=uncultured Agrococcus sp. TaxID=382258 RepID=UPI0025D1C11B|nr:NAD(P)H-binding protein [uncultured Agrococcus sp.]
MKIAVFGATGMAGSAIVTEALSRHHRVTAVSRHSSPRIEHERLGSRRFDVADSAALDALLSGMDAAVLTIRLAPGEESRLAPLTQGFLDVAALHRTQVLVVGGASPLRSPAHPDRLLITDPDYVPAAWRTLAQASLEQFEVCSQHTYGGWVYLSPPAVLEEGERVGGYRRGATTLLTDENGVSRITAADLAVAVVDELESPGNAQHFTVSQK